MTAPSEIPKELYDLIQNAPKSRESLKRSSDNRFAKSKLEFRRHAFVLSGLAFLFPLCHLVIFSMLS